MNVKSVIKKMGTKYCCHPDNYIKRLAVPLRDSVGVDLAATFRRVRERMAAANQANAAEVSRKVSTIKRRREAV